MDIIAYYYGMSHQHPSFSLLHSFIILRDHTDVI